MLQKGHAGVLEQATQLSELGHLTEAHLGDRAHVYETDLGDECHGMGLHLVSCHQGGLSPDSPRLS